MALTEFGKAVRMARIQIGETLLTMANALNVSSSFLSGLETGSKKVSKEWVNKISTYLEDKGYPVPDLDELAAVSNESVGLEGLSAQQKMLVAGFAKSPFTTEQLARFAELLEQMNKGDK
ncbi:helix-turn-helix domain-containing protein [Aeromonas dhakensis]|uniref:helix-turn-helix domain-containing protein n=1 Tax=Aeromonas dhakensis TaxID=196024 RepID=UPI00398817E8